MAALSRAVSAPPASDRHRPGPGRCSGSRSSCVAVVWIAPFVFIVFTSLKSNADVMATSAFTPPLDPAWENYASAWAPRAASAPPSSTARSSPLVKVPLGLVHLRPGRLCAGAHRGSVAAGAVPDRRLRHHDPVPGDAGAALRAGERARLINTYVGIILPYLAFGVPYQVFILHGFFKDGAEGALRGGL